MTRFLLVCASLVPNADVTVNLGGQAVLTAHVDTHLPQEILH